MNRAVKLVLAAALVLLLSGCYDYSEPDEKAWVLAMGLDKGRQNKLTVTAVIAVPKNIAGGGGGQPASGGGGAGGNFFTISMEAPTLLSTLELLDSVVDRRVNLSHTKWFVFSRELAEQGIAGYFAPISRFYQFRRSSYIVVCQERAEDFLAKGVPKLEDNVGKYFELMQRGWRYTEFIPFDSFHQFYLKSESPGVEPVAMLASLNRKAPVFESNSPKPKGWYYAGRIPRRGGGPVEVMGGAVFRKGKMVGILNGDQVGVQKMFFDTFRRTIVDVPDPKHPGRYIIVDVKPRQKPEVEVQIVDGYPQISVDLKLEGDIISIQSGENYTTPDRLHIVEQAVERILLKDINDTVAKSRELEADFLGFGLHAKKLFRTWPEWEEYRWDEKYPGAQIAVNVDYKVRRVGLVHEMAPLR
jgi:spore germination protein KC